MLAWNSVDNWADLTFMLVILLLPFKCWVIGVHYHISLSVFIFYQFIFFLNQSMNIGWSEYVNGGPLLV